MTIKQAIQLIEKNSEYTFFYNASDLENNTKRDYNSTGNIEKVLKDVFEGSNVSYVIKGKEVILKVTKTENTPATSKNRSSEPVSGLRTVLSGLLPMWMVNIPSLLKELGGY